METLVIDANRPPAAGKLTYKGRVEVPHPGMPMGPNTLGEWLWPVLWEYDPEADRTRIGFSYIEPKIMDFVGTQWDPEARDGS